MMNSQKMESILDCSLQAQKLNDYIEFHCNETKDGILTDISVGDLHRICIRLLKSIPCIDDDKVRFSIEQAFRQLNLKIHQTIEEMDPCYEAEE